MFDFLVFERLDSTQKYLIAQLKSREIERPVCVLAKHQTSGVGSRGNAWQGVECGLYFSFCAPLNALPSDLKLESASIFFGFIFKEILGDSRLWLKWPNDLFLGDSKLGGVICNVVGEFVVCGIGLNVESSEFCAIGRGAFGGENGEDSAGRDSPKDSPRDSGLKDSLQDSSQAPTHRDLPPDSQRDSPRLDSSPDSQLPAPSEIDFVPFLRRYLKSLANYAWRDVLTQYRAEFGKNAKLSFHRGGEILSLKNARLLDDGAIEVGGEVFYSLR